jgi:hypothetical protein
MVDAWQFAARLRGAPNLQAAFDEATVDADGDPHEGWIAEGAAGAIN